MGLLNKRIIHSFNDFLNIPAVKRANNFFQEKRHSPYLSEEDFAMIQIVCDDISKQRFKPIILAFQIQRKEHRNLVQKGYSTDENIKSQKKLWEELSKKAFEILDGDANKTEKIKF